MTKDNSTGKNKDFYDLGKKMFDAIPQLVRPTHWMDDRGFVVTAKFLVGPDSSSDYRDVYNIPCVKVRGKVVPIETNEKNT
jgi:hypothetical protein